MVRRRHSGQQNVQGQPVAGIRHDEWGLSEEDMVTDVSGFVIMGGEKREGRRGLR